VALEWDKGVGAKITENGKLGFPMGKIKRKRMLTGMDSWPGRVRGPCTEAGDHPWKVLYFFRAGIAKWGHHLPSAISRR
jgi:hypothetical protein